VEITADPAFVRAGFSYHEEGIQKALKKIIPSVLLEYVNIKVTHAPTAAAIKAAQK
jgi:hypothetical protein